MIFHGNTVGAQYGKVMRKLNIRRKKEHRISFLKEHASHFYYKKESNKPHPERRRKRKTKKESKLGEIIYTPQIRNLQGKRKEKVRINE